MGVQITMTSEVIIAKIESTDLDQYGGENKTVTNYPMYAKVEPARIKEGESEGQSFMSDKLKVTVYYRDWINSKCELTYRSELYDIESVVEIDRNHYSEIIATKRD